MSWNPPAPDPLDPDDHAASHVNGDDDIQSATAAQKGLATAAQITKLDGIEAAATADQTAAEIRALIVDLSMVAVAADQMTSVTASHAVTVIAPLAVDDVTGEMLVRLFDDTTEEGAAVPLFVPTWATNILITEWWRAITAPAATKTLQRNLYGMTTSTTPGAWSGASAATAITIPTSTAFVASTTTVAIATLNLTAGAPGILEVTRNPTGDDLVGDAALQMLQIGWN